MPGRGKRRTVERGIYRDSIGFDVVARAGKRSRSKRYPLDTDRETLRTWRDDTASDLRDEAQPTADTRSLAGAVISYLDKTKVPTSSPYRSALAAWVQRFGPLERRKLTPALAQQTIDRWANEGYAPQTVYYRRLALARLWKALDGPKVKTPVDDVRVKRPKARRPIWVSDDVINSVALEMLKHEAIGRLRNAKTRARFLVLASTGQRPAQLKRATPRDVDLGRGVWQVHAAKGGESITVFLNAEMLAAWQLFIAAKAWGHFDKRNFARVLKRCGWPVGARPYTLRHATGLTLRARGGDLADIQDHLGHTDVSTTRIYAAAVDARKQAISDLLDGRFQWSTSAVAPANIKKRPAKTSAR